MTLRGQREIERKLKRLPQNIQRRAVNRATRLAADPLVQRVRANAPIGASGALKRNVRKQRWRSRVFAAVYSVGVESGPLPIAKTSDGKFGVFRERGRREFDVGRTSLRRLTKRERRGSDPYYKGWVERGFRHARSGRRVAGKEYIARAIPASSNASINVFAREIAKEIARL